MELRFHPHGGLEMIKKPDLSHDFETKETAMPQRHKHVAVFTLEICIAKPTSSQQNGKSPQGTLAPH